MRPWQVGIAMIGAYLCQITGPPFVKLPKNMEVLNGRQCGLGCVKLPEEKHYPPFVNLPKNMEFNGIDSFGSAMCMIVYK